MSNFVFFISLLIVAQHVSGNDVPIIKSWRLRDVIASCWYVPWLQGGCQDQHEAITSRSRQLLMMGTWLPETCWATIRREIKNTKSDIYCQLVLAAFLQPRHIPTRHGTYQHGAITSRSRQLLMMGTWLPETCWATIRKEIKNTKSDI